MNYILKTTFRKYFFERTQTFHGLGDRFHHQETKLSPAASACVAPITPHPAAAFYKYRLGFGLSPAINSAVV
jgi:hypothetical protein